jgi:hypothetical protein
LLLGEAPAEPADIAAAAQSAGWRLPRDLAAAACADEDLGKIASRLPTDAIVTVFEGTGCILLPDPEGPGRFDQLSRAAGKATVAVGSAAQPERASRSWELAKALLLASSTGAVAGDGLLQAEDHLADLLLAGNPHLTSLLSAKRLTPLSDLTPKASQRMQETTLAYVRHHGNAVAMAAELKVHPQTARYRIARLRDLFGEDLDDPDARFELELALRASR